MDTNTVYFEYAIDDFKPVSHYMQALRKRQFDVMNEPRVDTPYILIIMFSAQYVQATINVGSPDLRRRPSRPPERIVVVRLDAKPLPPYLAIFDTIFAVNMTRFMSTDTIADTLAKVLRSESLSADTYNAGIPNAEPAVEPPIKPKVFISHHHSDSEDAFTSRLHGDLVAAGADVWVDVEQIEYGDIPDKINKGLKGREWLLFVMTPASLQSDWVNKEVNAAITMVQDEDMRAVIPIVAEPCNKSDIPALWRNLYRFDPATKGYAKEINRLIRVLGLSYQITDTN